MQLKPSGAEWTVREQIVHDGTTGFTFQFEMTPGGWPRLSVYGPRLRSGSREIAFDERGIGISTGPVMSPLRRPTWLRAVR